MTLFGDWVFKKGGKVGIAGKAGKRTIFRNWVWDSWEIIKIPSQKAGKAGQTFLSMKTY